MKLFFIGDFITDTGPGIANKAMRKGLGDNVNIHYSDARSPIGRIVELFSKTIRSDAVCFCSASRLNVVGILLARMLKKPVFYIMHGYSTFEAQFKVDELGEKSVQRKRRRDRYILRNVDRVFCVSKKFMKFMRMSEPEYRHKFDYCYNGIAFDEITKIIQENKGKRSPNRVISFGGGMRQKNNLAVCKAINMLNSERGYDLTYVVVGQPFPDKDEICSFDFVTYYDKVPYRDGIRLLSESCIYVQNSDFETFGLAIVEALLSGCNLLISANAGVTDLMSTIQSTDLIFNTRDINEIALKIERLITESNVERLQKGFDRRSIEYSFTANTLLEKISEYMGGN